MRQSEAQLKAFRVFRLRALWHQASLSKFSYQIKQLLDDELEALGVETCTEREARKNELYLKWHDGDEEAGKQWKKLSAVNFGRRK